MTTETFREEHYEVEEKSKGRWVNLGGDYPSEFDAKGVTLLGGLKGRKFRIIRCTTIREVMK